MQEKTIRIMKVAIIVVLGYVLVSLLIVTFSEKIKETEGYKNNPENWVDKVEKGVYAIDTVKVTDGMGYLEGDSEQYDDGTVNTAFISYGWVDGEFFEDRLVKNDEIIIDIGDELIAGDGVLDVFITETFERDVPYIDVFLDSDWKEKLGTVNMHHGKNFEIFDTFDFSSDNEVEKGIYHNRIRDDISRFVLDSDPVQKVGGLLIGDLMLSDWLNERPEGKTVIFFT